MAYQYCSAEYLIDLIDQCLGPERSELLAVKNLLTTKERLLGLYGDQFGRYTGSTAKVRILEIIAANEVNFKLLAKISQEIEALADPDSYKQTTEESSKDKLKRNTIAQSNQYSEATNFIHSKSRSASSEYSEEYDKEEEFDKEDTEAAKNIDSRLKGPTLNIGRAEQGGESQLTFNSVVRAEGEVLNFSFSRPPTSEDSEQEELEDSKIYLMDIGMSTNRTTNIGKSNALNVAGTDMDGSNQRNAKKDVYKLAESIRQQQNFDWKNYSNKILNSFWVLFTDRPRCQ